MDKNSSTAENKNWIDNLNSLISRFYFQNVMLMFFKTLDIITCHAFADQSNGAKVPFKSEDPFQWRSQEQAHNYQLSQKGGNEIQRDKKLHHHQPARQQFLPDQSVLVSIESMAAMEKVVKLVIWVAKFIETEFP